MYLNVNSPQSLTTLWSRTLKDARQCYLLSNCWPGHCLKPDEPVKTYGILLISVTLSSRDGILQNHRPGKFDTSESAELGAREDVSTQIDAMEDFPSGVPDVP